LYNKGNKIEDDNQKNMDEVDQSIMREEFNKALLDLRNKKALEIDENHAELVKN